MTLINIDAQKCNRDGLCVAACPVALIKLADKSELPATVPNADAMCIRCGHCVAVCPSGALSHTDMDLNDCLPIRKELVGTVEQVEQLLRSRRSIRSYKHREVPKEVMARLIDLAHYAPTAHNFQEVEWTVVSGREQVGRYARHAADYFRSVLEKDPETGKLRHYDLILYAWDMGFDAICRNAPHLILAHARFESPALAKYHLIDCATALAYMELAAPSLGLGTCWNGLLLTAIEHWPPLQKELAIPAQNRCYGALMTGYPQLKYHRMPTRRAPCIIWK